jgi:hypothetical protein
MVPKAKSRRESNYFIIEYYIEAEAELGGKSKKE